MAKDIFLKLAGVDGESTDNKYKGWVEIDSFSWGGTHEQTLGSATGGGGSGRVAFQDVHMSKSVDKSSPILLQKMATGFHFDDGKVIMRKAGGSQMEYLVVKMNNVFVTSVSISNSEGSEKAHESISLGFGKVVLEYTPQNKDGSPGSPTSGGWDLLTNKVP